MSMNVVPFLKTEEAHLYWALFPKKKWRMGHSIFYLCLAKTRLVTTSLIRLNENQGIDTCLEPTYYMKALPVSGSPFRLFCRANLIWFLSINSSIVGRIFRLSVKRILYKCKGPLFYSSCKTWNMIWLEPVLTLNCVTSDTWNMRSVASFCDVMNLAQNLDYSDFSNKEVMSTFLISKKNRKTFGLGF